VPATERLAGAALAKRPSSGAANYRERSMTLGTILIIVLILLLIGAIPRWGYSRGWGYGPSGGLGLVIIVVLILVLIGRV
jgi:hypothetical protein